MERDALDLRQAELKLEKYDLGKVLLRRLFQFRSGLARLQIQYLASLGLAKCLIEGLHFVVKLIHLLCLKSNLGALTGGGRQHWG